MASLTSATARAADSGYAVINLSLATPAVAVVSHALLPDVVRSLDTLSIEMALARSTAIILVPWKPAPDHGTRLDGIVNSFVCDAETFQAIGGEEAAARRPDRLCFALLDAILNERLSVARVVVRQLPSPSPVVRESAPRQIDGQSEPISLLMSHRGSLQHLSAALRSIVSADEATRVSIHVGLDVDDCFAYRELRTQFPEAAFVRVNPAPAGLFVVRQHLLEQASGELFCLQDSDDWSCSDRFTAQCAELHRTGADIVGCHELRVNEIAGTVEAFRLPLDVQRALASGYSESLLNGTIVARRQRVLDIGGYSTHQRIANDTQFMLRAFFSLRMRNIDGFHYLRRSHKAALTVAPETAFGTPLRTQLRDTWSGDFDAVRAGQLSLDESSLRPMKTTVAYRFREWPDHRLTAPAPMKWDASELAVIAPILATLDADTGPRQIGITNEVLTLDLSTASTPALAEGCAKPRAQAIRHICGLMGFDLVRLPRLRFEHKLIQALVLQAYCGDAIPVTRGLAATLRSIGPSDSDSDPDSDLGAGEFLASAYPVSDVFIKRTLGYGSAERKDADARDLCLAGFQKGRPAPDAVDAVAMLHDEEFVLQERVAIQQEFRVHTVEGSVVPGLTFRRFSGGIAPGERDMANTFVQGVLDRLPNALVRGAVSAWDVARTTDGSFKVIEVNLTGMHLVFEAGFHTSGYFLGRWAAPSAAKLVAFLERRYGVTFRLQGHRESDLPIADVFRRLGRWLELYRIALAIDAVTEVHACPPGSSVVSPDALSPEERTFNTIFTGMTRISMAVRDLT